MNLQISLKLIEKLRKDGATVHCITNSVVQNFTSNILLACGATPSMTTSKEEVADFVSGADSLLLNLGTLDSERREVCYLAARAAQSKNIPFVLDPVMCNKSKKRLAFAQKLLTFPPNILRVNAAESEALSDAIKEIASHTNVVVTGKTDKVLQDGADISVDNGHPLMDKVIGIGCAQGAVIAALAVQTKNPSDAILAALVWFGVAGEIAAENSKGPGDFQIEFINQLHTVEIATLADRAKVY